MMVDSLSAEILPDTLFSVAMLPWVTVTTWTAVPAGGTSSTVSLPPQAVRDSARTAVSKSAVMRFLFMKGTSDQFKMPC